MVKIIYRLLFLLISNSCFSQEYSDMWEMYRNSTDFVNKKTFYLADFSFKQNFNNTLFYQPVSTDRKVKRISKKEAIWGIYKDSILFLNVIRMGMNSIGKWRYVKVREYGKYCYFMGNKLWPIAMQDALLKTSLKYGAIDGAAAERITYDKYEDNIPYVINLEHGEVVHILDYKYLELILRNFPDLLSQFKSEAKPDELETLLKYIRILNKL